MLKSISKPFLLSRCSCRDIEVRVVGLTVIASVISESRILGYTRITYNPTVVDDNCLTGEPGQSTSDATSHVFCKFTEHR